MQWNNQDATSSPGAVGATPTRTQSMKLIDDSGNVIATFSRSASGTIAFTVNDKSFVSPTDTSISLAATSIVLSALPTSDPEVEGALWNDTGTVKISAGGA